MTRLLDVVSRLVTANPIVTLILLLAVTIVLGAGFTRMAPQADSTAFLPDDSRVYAANGRIADLFGSKSETISATLLFRGDALTPEGLAQIDGAMSQILSHPEVTVAITGGDTIAHLDDSLGSVGWTLDDSVRQKLDAVSAPVRTIF